MSTELKQTSEHFRESYNEKKDAVLSLLEETKAFLTDINSEQADAFGKLYQSLKEGEFSIVVVGEFSAGKSMLLNALMRKRLLPSASSETTATVNFLRHQEKAPDGQVGTVFYADGTTEGLQDVSLESLDKYVTTKGDHVAEKVTQIDLYLESDFLKDNVTLVDSPGLNGLREGHAKITRDQIMCSHASIFVFSSDHPGSKTDFETIHDLQEKVSTIIFVLNKIDLVKESEETIEQIIDTLKANYKKQFPEAKIPEIYPVSAQDALAVRNVEQNYATPQSQENATRLDAFETRLMKFLTEGEKAQQQCLAPIEKTIQAVNDARSVFECEIKVLQGAVAEEDILKKISDLQEVIATLEISINQSSSSIKQNLSSAFREATNQVGADFAKLKEKNERLINNISSIDDINEVVAGFGKRYDRQARQIAQDAEERLSSALEEVVRLHYSLQCNEIEQAFADKKMPVSLQTELTTDLPDHFIELGFAAFDEKIERLEQALAQLEQQKDTAEGTRLKARKAEREKTKIEDELASVREYRRTLNGQVLPAVERRLVEEQNKKWYGGVLGWSWTILTGRRTVTQYVEKEDDSARREAMQQRDRELAELNNQDALARNALNQLGKICIEEAETELRLLETQTAQMTDKLSKAYEDAKKEMQEKCAKVVKKYRWKMEDYCDACTNEFTKQLANALKLQERAYCELVGQIVIGTLKAQLEQKKASIELLQAQLKDSEQEKTAKIEKLTAQISIAKNLCTKAVELKVVLKETSTDYITQE